MAVELLHGECARGGISQRLELAGLQRPTLVVIIIIVQLADVPRRLIAGFASDTCYLACIIPTSGSPGARGICTDLARISSLGYRTSTFDVVVVSFGRLCRQHWRWCCAGDAVPGALSGR